MTIPPGYTEFCGVCGKPKRGCRCVGTLTVSAPNETLWIQAAPRDGDTVSVSSVFGTSPAVSLPVVEQTPAEETQEPSGWRDRPGLL